MEPNDVLEIKNNIHKSVLDYYESLNREARYFLETKNLEWAWTYLHFLIDRKYVIRYGFGIDRILCGGVEFGIGPNYFGADAFWSYENSTRFMSSISEDSIFHNLRLLDEFWDGKDDKC